MDAHHNIVRIVGIGASAGGLAALREMIQSLPSTGSLCYVIAQHVSPAHISMLMDLLMPFTQLKVEYLRDLQPPQAGTVYITPPNSDVSLERGVFRLTEPRQAIGPKPSVNHFFQSLADELGEQAIGIILSGTGSDGASGMRAIKAAGGITIVQDPGTAKYDGMPKAAIYTDSVDLILAASKIGPALARLLLATGDITPVLEEDRETEEYLQIGKLVRLNTAFKLSDYKPGTVRRRIARRMNILGMGSLAAYIDFLQSHKDESLFLMRDTFISVTSFFRDKEAFHALEGVINELVRNGENKKVIRIWVPGCASGEEVYSIAILFEEALVTQQRQGFQYMIFASDLDDGNIEKARAALYPR
ncbi:chemotaxis protein CheB [Nitrosomonas sp. ANs5]|uniref:chemotaxis protein CheB n=1 Tax=Nitrosomonas sp. ANs5 TaxID=3423941 RepID=UPI003D349FC2